MGGAGQEVEELRRRAPPVGEKGCPNIPALYCRHATLQLLRAIRRISRTHTTKVMRVPTVQAHFYFEGF